jgi:hypothetical protein
MNTINTAATAIIPDNFDMYDKGLELVTEVLGEEMNDVFNIVVTKGVCKVFLPLSVPLISLGGRDDITVNFVNNNSVITIH